MSFVLALLMQVGPFVGAGTKPASPLPPELQNRKAKGKQAEKSVTLVPIDPFQRCLSLPDPDEAIAQAQLMLNTAKGGDAARANHCLGLAFARQGRWTDAEAALVAGRDAAEDEQSELKARLGALAGFSALESRNPQRALPLLDQAAGDADMAGEKQLSGDIELDRARALVMLKRESEAGAALAKARGAIPTNAEAWLLSATLSRRMNDLPAAQSQIEEAARLAPTDQAIGLEAGVIAAVSGRMEAAQRSWQSVIALDAKSPAADNARSYLKQIAP